LQAAGCDDWSQSELTLHASPTFALGVDGGAVSGGFFAGVEGTASACFFAGVAGGDAAAD
jgi:hypothetical protein